MDPSTREFRTRTRARYAETDASGIVYYGSHLVYFELGRVEMFRELGLSYDLRIPIAETWCRYVAPARFDDLLEVRTRVAELRSKGFRLAGEIWRIRQADDGAEQAELLAEGYTAMVTTGVDRRPVPLPAEFVRALAAPGGA